MAKRKGHQKGPQRHAEGQHGERTRAAFLDSIQHKQPGSNAWDAAHRGQELSGYDEGGHRLAERRAQHDEKEKNSENERMNRELERHGLPEGSTPRTKGSTRER